MGSGPPNGTSLRGTASFDFFCVKVGASVMAVSEWKNPPSQKIVETKGYAKSRMCRKETHYPICRKFCMVVGSTNIITCANSGSGYIPHRLSSSPLQYSHYRARVWSSRNNSSTGWYLQTVKGVTHASKRLQRMPSSVREANSPRPRTNHTLTIYHVHWKDWIL